jgi:hypothetical protein
LADRHAGCVDYDTSSARAFFSAIFATPLNQELSYRLNLALEVTDALWDLVPVVVTAGKKYDEQSPADLADVSPAGRRLSSDCRSQVREMADAILAAQEGPELDESALGGLSVREVLADPFGLLNRLTSNADQTELMLSAMGQVAAFSSDEIFYMQAYTRAKLKSERTPVLLRALFLTAVGTMEPLVTRLMVLLLYYTDQKKYASLADPALEKKARGLCFGSPKKWRDSFAKLGVSSLVEAVDWQRLGNLWEDRNVIAHRGSVTDTQHSAQTGVPEATVLELDAAAVQSAIDVIGAARFAFIGCIWDRIAPGLGEYAAEMAGPLLPESLRVGRWEQAELLGKFQVQLLTDPESKEIAKVNTWLAIEMGRGPEAIRGDVEAWDVADLPPVYQLARHVLLREDAQALELLDNLRSTGVISQIEVDTWPLFDRLRGEGQLQVPEPLPTRSS